MIMMMIPSFTVASASSIKALGRRTARAVAAASAAAVAGGDLPAARFGSTTAAATASRRCCCRSLAVSPRTRMSSSSALSASSMTSTGQSRMFTSSSRTFSLPTVSPATMTFRRGNHCPRTYSSTISLSENANDADDGAAKTTAVPFPINDDEKVVAPPMVYIAGEEMTHYACQLILRRWFEPYFDLRRWETYDLSCKSRDETDDRVLTSAVEAGKRVGAIFKEPTITPSAQQQAEMKLSKPLSSPNGAMRRGWNGITISRDTIHIEGMELGYKNPVFFERHAVGGEYGAGWNDVGKGTLLTTYMPDDDDRPPFVVDKRDLTDEHNVVVVYHNPYDNVAELAHLFFTRCLDADITPYVVTKKTVFKWQEGFWSTMKDVFDAHYKDQFLQKGLLDKCHGELQHLISDAATMQLIRWTDGGFGMAAHNYDGDMLTDQIAQVHRSPGFITSNLVGKNDDDGSLIKEFEASHGTVSDLWRDHLAGKETSLNPLGLVEAMIGAIRHAARLQADRAAAAATATAAADAEAVAGHVNNFTETLRTALHNTFRYGQGTRDMSGPSGYTTEDFIDKVAWRLRRYLERQFDDEVPPPVLHHEPDRKYRRNYDVDEEAVNRMFRKYDHNGDGYIDYEEFTEMLVKMGIAPHEKQVEDDHRDEFA